MCTAPRGNHSTLDGVAQFVQTALLSGNMKKRQDAEQQSYCCILQISIKGYIQMPLL